MIRNPHSSPRSLLRGAAGIAAALALAACASAPVPPTEALHAAELAIANADQARAADFAAPELTEARSKLTAAHAAVAQEKMVAAQQLAEQSRADADLATAKAAAARAQAVNDDMRKSTESMKQEMQRNAGAHQ